MKLTVLLAPFFSFVLLTARATLLPGDTATATGKRVPALFQPETLFKRAESGERQFRWKDDANTLHFLESNVPGYHGLSRTEYWHRHVCEVLAPHGCKTGTIGMRAGGFAAEVSNLKPSWRGAKAVKITGGGSIVAVPLKPWELQGYWKKWQWSRTHPVIQGWPPRQTPRANQVLPLLTDP